MDTRLTEITTSYDEIPYESHPFPQSHPDRMATLGRIFGLKPEPVTGCRVLEMGCASGGNLIPMAFHLPESNFVGVDASIKQVEMGRKIIHDLSLQNIRIEHASILDVDASWGIFDYVISHGVYSWVPDKVQDKMLAICAENLAPEGIAYISYNTYPGWHMREMIRRMMIYHTRQFSDSRQQVQQGRALIEFLSNSVPTENNHYGMLLKTELELIKRSNDSYLFHEHLEEFNQPLYFHQFADRAAGHGLQYLGEAEFGTMLASGFPKEVAETLKRISPNIINTEQYMDFIRNRFFRQTILCRQGITLKRNLGPDDVLDLIVASSAQPETTVPDMSPNTQVSFRIPEGASVQTNRPLTKAALLVLRENWPRALTIDSLLREACLKIGDSTLINAQTRAILAADLLQCYSARVVDFRTWQADFTTKVSDKPRVSKLAAYLGANGRIHSVNQRHELVALDVIGQNLVGILDGTRDRAAMLEHLFIRTRNGAINVNRDGKPLTDQWQVKDALLQALEAALSKMATSTLLIS